MSLRGKLVDSWREQRRRGIERLEVHTMVAKERCKRLIKIRDESNDDER